MSRTFYDRTLGREVAVPSRRELRYRANLTQLQEFGINPRDVHCGCCGIRLTDLSKITFNGASPIGPECSKHPFLFPCGRHARAA